MDSKNNGLNGFINKLRVTKFIVWAFFSTIAYSIGCIFLSVFSRKVARCLAQLWNKHLLFVGGIKVEVNGLDKIDKDKRYVFVANHSSHLDIPVIYSSLENQVSFIAKKELFRIPFFGWGLTAVGHVWIDRTNARKARESFTRAIQHLKTEHVSLVIFPEGTRSIDGKVGEFKKGSFTLAIESGVQVVPLAIRNTGKILQKKSLVVNPGTAIVNILDPIDITPDMKKADLAQMVHDAIKSSVECD